MIGKPRGHVVLLCSAVPAPLASLSRLLARTLDTDFSDRVALIRLDLPGPRGKARHLDEPGLLIHEVAPRDDPFNALEAAVERHRARHDYLFLDIPPGDAVLLRRAGRLADRVVFLTRDTFAPIPVQVRPGSKVVFVVAIDSDHTDYRERLFRAGTVRLSRQPGEFSGRRRLSELPRDGRESLSRLARALTDRTVGLALGGGGAWGFAHVALIQGLLAAQIPIDIVSGVSFGSVVGAFYCSDGLEGLENLQDSGLKLSLGVWGSILNSGAVTRFIEKGISARYLERLAVPLLPLATNVDGSEPEPIRMGRIGVGVRASSCLPGLLSPTIIGTVRYVDGGMSCNVPANLLPGEGADLIIASNVIQRHKRFDEHETPPTGRLGVWLSEVNPIGRAKDLILTLTSLTNRTGEVMSLCAHVTYQAQPNRYQPWDWTKGRAIVETCRAEVEPVVARAREGWRVLRREGGAEQAGR